MFNDIHIGPVTLHMYGLMIAIGFASALLICSRRGKKQGLDEDIIFGIFINAIVGALVGCRLLYYIVELDEIIKNPSILWNFKNGYVVYGGIIGGILFNYVYCRIKKVYFLSYFDLVMPSVAIAQGFGRIGCFCAGCCYGRETASWFGITFHNSGFAPNGVKLLPTQLISSAFDFIFGLLLIAYSNRHPKKGRTAAVYLMGYGVGRFVIEFFRNDFRGSIGPFSTSQLISFAIVFVGIVLYITMGKAKSVETAEVIEGVDETKEDK